MVSSVIVTVAVPSWLSVTPVPVKTGVPYVTPVPVALTSERVTTVPAGRSLSSSVWPSVTERLPVIDAPAVEYE